MLLFSTCHSFFTWLIFEVHLISFFSTFTFYINASLSSFNLLVCVVFGMCVFNYLNYLQVSFFYAGMLLFYSLMGSEFCFDFVRTSDLWSHFLLKSFLALSLTMFICYWNCFISTCGFLTCTYLVKFFGLSM